MKARNQYSKDGTGRNFTVAGLEKYRRDLCAQLRAEGKGLRAESYEKLTLKQFSHQGGYVLPKERNHVMKKLLPEALQYILDYKEKHRDSMFSNHGYYLTATDLENQVRSFMIEDLEGLPRGSRELAWGKPRYHVLVVRGDLFGACRTFLLNHPNLKSHNFGRGHISGQRFRPHSWPLSAAEQKTLDKKARPKTVHYSDGRVLLCQKDRKQGKGWRRPRRSDARGTNVVGDVTCVRCKNLLQKGETCKQSSAA